MQRAPKAIVEGPVFQGEGWAVNATGSTVAHYYKLFVGGQRASLCRNSKTDPRTLRAPLKNSPNCRSCAEIVARSGGDADHRPAREMKGRLKDLIDSFLKDPQQGPRLYGCPVCGTIYQGRMAGGSWTCAEGGHPVAVVIELARKD